MHNNKGIVGALVGGAIIFVILSFIAFYPAYHLTREAPPDTYYTKPHFLLQDYYQYLSMMKQGRSGISGRNRYTTEPFEPHHLHIYYELLGRLAQTIGITDPMMYYGGIAVGLFLFVLAAILFITTLVPRGYRLLAGLFVFLASPLPGWWIPVFGTKIYLGTDVWTKTDLLQRHAMVPHHMMGVSLTLLATWFLLRFIDRKKLVDAGVAACLYSTAAVVFAVPVVLFGGAFCVLSVFYGAGYGILLLKKRVSIRILLSRLQKERTLCVGVGMTGILTFCTLFFFVLNQSRITEIADMEYQLSRYEQFPYLFSVFILSHGILLLFYPFALWRIKRAPVFRELFLVALTMTPWIWYILSGYIPLVNKFRLVFTSPYLFGGILATLGVITIVQRVKKKFRGLFLFGVTALILATTAGGILYWVSETTNSNDRYTNIYIPVKNLEAVGYLDTQTPKFSRVFSTFYTGMYLPAFSNAVVYVGQEMNPNFNEKFALSEQFFQGTMPVFEAGQLLKDQAIDYVFWDGAKPPDLYNDYLKEVFRNESATIFQVVNIP